MGELVNDEKNIAYATMIARWIVNETLEAVFRNSQESSIGEVRFVTNSKYKGTRDSLGMSGSGRYTLPYDVVYDGELRDDEFHGRGVMRWPDGQTIEGVWDRGTLRRKRIVFEDGLEYESDNWSYCAYPDRRFFESRKNGLRPAGSTLLTNNETREIPIGCYDTGYGVYNPQIYAVTSYSDYQEIIYIPTKEEADWIKKYCRRGQYEPTEAESRLRANWPDVLSRLPCNILPFTRDSPENWWQRSTAP